MEINLIQGDCLEKLKELPDNSVDSVVTDPPYELGFMGKTWDSTGIANNKEMWAECLRVLKPGGHLLAFSGTRTYHRMAVAIEDAGFEVRDMIEWVMGSGFPKSLNIFKQLEKRCDCGIMSEYGERTTKNTKHYLRPLREADIQKAKHITEEQREILFKGLPKQGLPTEEVREGLFISERAGEPSMEGRCYLFQKEGELYRCAICQMPAGVFSDGEKGWLYNGAPTCNGNTHRETSNEDGSSTSREPQSRRQQDREPCSFCKQFGAQAIRAFGWGSAMKPAHEPICVARKPLGESNIADNFLKWGTGGINIDESRVESNEDMSNIKAFGSMPENKSDEKGFSRPWMKDKQSILDKQNAAIDKMKNLGRFPANLIHDGSDEVKECFPETKTGKAIRSNSGGKTFGGENTKPVMEDLGYDDNGGNASRFFKSIIYQPKASKSERNKGCEGLEGKEGIRINAPRENEDIKTPMRTNNHPTVKPVALMEYLIKMITPKGGVVLDPFMGSGSTGVAAKQNGFSFIGIDMTPEYVEIAKARINAVGKGQLF